MKRSFSSWIPIISPGNPQLHYLHLVQFIIFKQERLAGV